MKIEKLGPVLRFDLTTKCRSGSAAIVPGGDADTEVYHGPLCTSVSMRDLGIEIIMDPRPGAWRDAAWARQRAWELLTAELGPTDLGTIVGLVHDAARADGRRAALRSVRQCLGIEGGRR